MMLIVDIDDNGSINNVGCETVMLIQYYCTSVCISWHLLNIVLNNWDVEIDRMKLLLRLLHDMIMTLIVITLYI